MCIAAWMWQVHPVYELLLLLNRDEFHDRPTIPVGWWGECGSHKILGGRDELGGGTWLGCTKDGKLAFLTNFREPELRTSIKSRGELPKRFLEGTKSPSEFADEIANEADQYNGFNLIVADFYTKTMFYISNRPKEQPVSPQEVPPGIHVLSNANLDSPWPKAEKLRNEFSKILTNHREEELCEKEMVEKLMTDETKADRSMLPVTGCNPEWEFVQSSIFIETDTERVRNSICRSDFSSDAGNSILCSATPLQGRYGTRSMAAISVKRSNVVTFYERYIESSIWREHSFQYGIEKLELDRDDQKTHQ